MPTAGAQGTRCGGRFARRNHEMPPSTYWRFGELKDPEISEITKDRTEWCGGEAMGIGRAVPPERPAEGPRSRDRDEA